jgi:hypothetical protein
MVHVHQAKHAFATLRRMANYYAIAAVTAALQGLLSSARPPELSSASIESLQLPDFQKARPIDEGVAIVLYRVAVSAMPRTLSGRPDADGRRKLPSLPVDLYYLLSPFGRTAGMQQRLLGWLMRTLEDNTIITSSELNHFGGPEQVFVDGETVSVVPEPLPLQDLTSLWESLRPNAHVSVAYVARLVHLESIRQPVEGALVQARDFAYAKGPA